MNWQDSIQELRRIMQEDADAFLLREMQELQEKVKDEKFYLVVVGMFKRGKSTLINALLGKTLAPVAVTPLTAVITLFEHSTACYGEVFYHGKDAQRIAVEDIPAYITEEENPLNKRGVSYVKIHDPATLLKSISLVDTPGLGSLFEHNTHTTLSFVPKIDAALFVLSADTPVSKADLDFLIRLQQAVPRILFVLNKSDLLSPDELQRMLAYNRRSIAAELKVPENAIEFIAVSARLSADEGSNMQALKGWIDELAENEKKAILEESVGNQFQRLCRQAHMQLRLRLDALQMPLQELEEKQEKLKTSVTLMESQRDEFESIIQAQVKRLQREADKQVNALSSGIRKRLHAQLVEHWEPAYREMEQQGLKKYQEELMQVIILDFEQAQQGLEAYTKDRFRELLEAYHERSQTFLHELSHYLKSLWGMDFRLIISRFDLDVYTAFYFDYGKGASVEYLYPSFLARRLRLPAGQKAFMHKLYQHLNRMLIINGSSVMYDLHYKIQESFRKFNYDLHQYLQQLLENIRQIIQDTIAARTDTASVSKDEISRLQDKLATLDALLEPDN